MFTGNTSQYYFSRSGKMSAPPKPARVGLVRPIRVSTHRNQGGRDELNLEAVRAALNKMDVRRKPTASENGNRVFKGSALVSALLYTSPRKFKCRASAFKFARRLFRLGFIRSIFGWTTFEDSSHLYRWEDENVPPRSSSHSAMMSYPHQTPFHKSSLDGHHYGEGLDNAFLNDVKGRLLTEGDKPGGYLIDSFFRDLERNFPEDCRKPSQKLQSQYWQNKRASTTSTDSSADPYSLYKSRDRLYPKSVQPASMASSREHSAIPEEAPDTYMLGRLRSMQMPPLEYEMSNTPATYTSHASSGGESAIGADGSNRRFADQNFSYSDNEKQLLEEMKRMKKEHQHILRSYEDRINKLMTKMHELRSIAEMLESSSTKSSPYGVIPAKGGALGSLEARLDQDRSWTGSNQNDSDVPPPLPPRPGRGTKVYPNKPILQPRRKMKYIPWKRIILSDLGTPGSQLSVWHTMVEPKVDTEALESQFNDESDASRKQLSLYEDVVARRGRSRNQVSVVDRDKAQIFVSKIHFLKLTLQDVLQAISNLHTTFLDEEGSDSLLDLVLSRKDMDRVLHHAKKKGVGHLDITDFIMFEVSRVDHFRTKAELLRFQQRIHDYLFDIDQQLKDVRTACEEICSSVFLKNLLETLLAVGNHMNGGTAEGQADGYHLHILANLKATENKDGLGNLLEFLVRLYCELYTQDNCRFCLPEPSNMRHAAQVSLTDINKALEGLGDDLCHVRKNISPLFHSSNGPLSEAISGRLQQFFVKAEESIEAQRKHYRETKDNFQRTAAYFMFGGENEELCTKTFFGTWATFLHDCKHYWKDIQRKLAKERFQAGFVIAPDKKVPACKPPLSDPPPEIPPKPSATVSSSSLQNHSSPKKHESEAYPRSRDPWEIPETAGTLSRQRDSHHAKTGSDRQHRLGPGPEVKSPPSRHKTYKDTGSNRSSSPKRIISTPPTGDIHRPVPTPPKPSKLFSNIPQGGRQSNYENQEAQQIQQHHSVATQSKDHSPSRPTTNAPPSPKRAQIPVPELEDPHRKQSNGFSLKSWLRKESGKPKQGNQEQMLSSKETDQQSKSNTAFVKLRNTVVQKFGNPSPSRRPIDSSPVKENRDPRHNSPSKYNPGQRDSSSGRSRSRSRSPSTERGHPRHGGHVDSDAEAEEEVAFYNGRSSKPREKSPSKQSDMKTGPPTTAPKPQTDVNPNFQPFGIIDPNTGTFRPTGQGKSESDMNNNDAGTNPVAQSKRSRGRDRAPLALGSNISLSDPYPRPEQDPKQSAQRQSWDVNPQSHATTNKAHRHYNTIAGTSPVNPIPTYRAKVIHMYENQCKYDAGDVNANVQHIRGSQDHFHQAQKYNTIGQGRSSNYFLMHSKDGEQGRHGNPRRDPGEEYYPDQRRHRQSHSRPTPERDVHSKGASYQQSQLNPRDKAAAHAQSITSLIDRFEAGKGPPPPNFAENPVAMTSTPVTQRKNVPLTLPADSHGKDEQNSHRYPQHNQVQNPFPLLDGVSQAATSSGNVQAELHRRSDAGGDGVRHHVDMSRAGHHSYPPQPSSHRSYDSRRPEHDEGYRDQLRRAFNNNNNVTPRYPKANMGFAGQAQTFQRSPPQIMRAVPVKQSAYHHGGVTV